MGKLAKVPRTIAAIQIEWGACVGSQKGQYRLGYAEVGTLLTALADMTDDYYRSRDELIEATYPGCGKRVSTASDAGAKP